jgi:hypothetical protein
MMHLLLRLLWLGNRLLEDLKDLLVGDLLLSLALVLGDIKRWWSSNLGDTVLGDSYLSC